MTCRITITYLVECFPLSAQERDDLRERIRTEEDGMSSHPGKIADLQDAVGEDSDETIDDIVNVTDEPTVSKKRELLKIDRTLDTQRHVSSHEHSNTLVQSII